MKQKTKDIIRRILKYIIHSLIIYLTVKYILDQPKLIDIIKIVVICSISLVILDMYVPILHKNDS